MSNRRRVVWCTVRPIRRDLPLRPRTTAQATHVCLQRPQAREPNKEGECSANGGHRRAPHGQRRHRLTRPSPLGSTRRFKSRCHRPSARQCGSSSPWLVLTGGRRRRRRLEQGFAQRRKLFGRTFSFLVSYNSVHSTA